MIMGPFGQLIVILKTIYDRWEDIKNAFKVGGIKEAIRSIGITIFESMLTPLRQVYTLIAKLPGAIGRAAQSNIDSIDKVQGKIDRYHRSNRYWAARQGIEEKQAAERHEKYQNALYKASGGRYGKAAAKIGKLRIPGTDGDGDGSNEGNGVGKETNDAIATGGTKNTTINITMKNLVEAINIMRNDFRESADNMSVEVQDARLRSLAMAVTTAS